MSVRVRAVHEHLDPQRARHRHDVRTGKIWPVRFVMCVTSMTFVRGVIAARNWSTRYCCDGGGTLKLICLSTIPSRRARCPHS